MIPKLEKFREGVLDKLPPTAAGKKLGTLYEKVYCSGYMGGIEAALVAFSDPHLSTDEALELLQSQVHEAREIAKRKPEPSSC